MEVGYKILFTRPSVNVFQYGVMISETIAFPVSIDRIKPVSVFNHLRLSDASENGSDNMNISFKTSPTF